MSDHLVKRLRGYEDDRTTMFRGKTLTDEAADLIEELKVNINIKAEFIDATINQLAASDQRIEELEAKLDDKEAECRYLRGQVGLLTAKLERAVFLTDADFARIDEICENPPPITQHMQASLDRILTQTGEK